MHGVDACAGKRRKTEQERLIEEHFRDIDDGDDDADVDADVDGDDRGARDGGSGGSGDDDADDEDGGGGGRGPHGQPSVVGAGPEGPAQRRCDAGDEEGAAAARKRTRMMEGREEASGDLFARNTSVAARRELPLGVRAGAEDEEGGATRPRPGRGSGRGMGVWCAICQFVKCSCPLHYVRVARTPRWTMWPRHK